MKQGTDDIPGEFAYSRKIQGGIEPFNHTPAKKGVEVKATVGEMKKKILVLKEEKKTAISSKDKKKTNVLRRRINRLKKRSKKVARA